jgi:glycosyltransferase involved in cell wall biosynthesis
MDNMPQSLSLIIPVYNEEENIKEVIQESDSFLKKTDHDYEIIIVDDGSRDKTFDIAKNLQKKHKKVKLLSHIQNMGKTHALLSGFKKANNDVFVIMDGDCQFTPKDIPRFIEKLNEGFDVVNGWGEKKEPTSKKIASYIFNTISRRMWGLDIHQFNLGYKAFRRETVKNMDMSHDEHRYMLPLLKTKGFKIGEVKVNYYHRKAGTSKYGPSRLLVGVLDMIALRLRMSFLDRPMRLFGTLGVLLFIAGIFGGLSLLYFRLIGELFSEHIPLTLTTILLLLSGIQLFAFGFLADTMSTINKEVKKMKE